MSDLEPRVVVDAMSEATPAKVNSSSWWPTVTEFSKENWLWQREPEKVSKALLPLYFPPPPHSHLHPVSHRPVNRSQSLGLMESSDDSTMWRWTALSSRLLVLDAFFFFLKRHLLTIIFYDGSFSVGKHGLTFLQLNLLVVVLLLLFWNFCFPLPYVPRAN